jgi:hypothetical protein
MKAWMKDFVANWKTVLITFEIFWVAIYLLDVASRTAAPEAMQFVYANF